MHTVFRMNSSTMLRRCQVQRIGPCHRKTCSFIDLPSLSPGFELDDLVCGNPALIPMGLTQKVCGASKYRSSSGRPWTRDWPPAIASVHTILMFLFSFPVSYANFLGKCTQTLGTHVLGWSEWTYVGMLAKLVKIFYQNCFFISFFQFVKMLCKLFQ